MNESSGRTADRHSVLGFATQWAKGYAAGERVYEDVMDMIDREAEGSDSLEVTISPALTPAPRPDR